MILLTGLDWIRVDVSNREMFKGREILFTKLMFGATAALALALAIPASQAETVKYAATLNGASEVPATDSKGTGEATLTYDTASKKLTYTLTYSGLTGDALAAHFHGPAVAGANGGIEAPITIGPSPIKGEATLTDQKAADLADGKWYVNIHTKEHPGGEIRGQVTKAGM
jgi:hypothetical protein